ncbi:MAG: radical SAM protein [Elusimicrobiota bacterium]
MKKMLDALCSLLEKNIPRGPLRKSPPEELHLEVTYRCDSRCVMCELWKKKDKKDEIKFTEIKRFVRESRYLKNVKRVILSGGEPWLRDDFVEICRFFSKASPDAEIIILSNLMNKSIILKKLGEIFTEVPVGKILLGTSLDGIGTGHDRIRGKRGAYERLLNTVNTIKKTFPVHITFTFTLSPGNYDQILPVYQKAKEQKWNMGFQVFVQKRDIKRMLWTEDKLRTVDKQVRKIMQAIYGETGDIYPLLPWHYLLKYVKQPKRYFQDCPCGEKFAMVDPYGGLYMCPVHKDKTIGNIKKEKFDDLWFSEKADKLREFFGKRECHCWLCCAAGYMLNSAVVGKK